MRATYNSCRGTSKIAHVSAAFLPSWGATPDRWSHRAGLARMHAAVLP
jgi:hypothetical protein